jgi:undecaprenyl-diphosphatase
VARSAIDRLLRRERPRRLRLPRGAELRRARRRRHPLLAALGDADQALRRALRIDAPHGPGPERAMKALALAGEWGAIWMALGTAGALADPDRRPRWARAALVAPVAVGLNYAVKVAVGRERPLIDEHPPLGRAPSKLSFPSAHATSSLAGATALRRVEPRARLPLYALAAGICVSRPYLGMHYPSDVLAGAALGLAIGGLFPAVGTRTLEERLRDLASDGGEGPATAPAGNTPPGPSGPA